MSTNKKPPTFSPAKKCECCGKIVVLLRRSDVPAGEIRRVVVYIKGWDGNPWYVPATHRRHPRKPIAIHLERKRTEGRDPDPFFALD